MIRFVVRVAAASMVLNGAHADTLHIREVEPAVSFSLVGSGPDASMVAARLPPISAAKDLGDDAPHSRTILAPVMPPDQAWVLSILPMGLFGSTADDSRCDSVVVIRNHRETTGQGIETDPC